MSSSSAMSSPESSTSNATLSPSCSDQSQTLDGSGVAMNVNRESVAYFANAVSTQAIQNGKSSEENKDLESQSNCLKIKGTETDNLA
jgi:hypothetical protein